MSPYRNFHEGEARLQKESGVDTALFDRLVEEPFQPALSDVEARFINQRTFSIAGAIDSDGRPWVSPLIGRAGELFVVQDATTVRIAPRLEANDPLYADIKATGELGVLYFDPSRRRRMKSVGRADVGSDGSIVYRMRRAFGLCSKYIFKRAHMLETTAAASRSTTSTPERRGVALDDDDRAQLELADTVFLASHHVEHGTDPTHRGGPSGFVTVRDETTISMPDYVGNGMFQTLGNLLLDNRIGLLSIDFATGRSVQVTGRGAITVSPTDDEYSVRTLAISVEEVRTTWPVIGLWTDLEAFELRPGLINPGTPFLRRP